MRPAAPWAPCLTHNCPIPAGGTYNNIIGATSDSACKEVEPNYWAPMGSSLPLKCPSSGFMCPGAAHDTEHKGSLPIEVAQGRRIEIQNVTRYRCSLTLQLAISSEDFDMQQTELEEKLSHLYGTPVSLQMQAAGSVVVALIADNLDAAALDEFKQRVQVLGESDYSNLLHVDVSVASAISVEAKTDQIPIDVVW